MSPRTKIIVAILVLIVAGVVVALVVLGGRRPTVEVEAVTVERSDLTVTVTASGKVESDVRADVFPPSAGVLAEVRVTDGQPVTQGAVLAVMDTEPLKFAVAQAEAALAQAQSGLAAVDDQAPAAADVAAARAATDAAWAAYRSAQTAARAVASQGPSKTDLAAATAATAAAKNAYAQASSAYNAAKSLYDAVPTPENLVTLQAAESARDQARVASLSAQATEQQLRSVDLSTQQAAADAGVEQAYAAYLGARAQQDKLEALDLSSQRRAARQGVEQAREALALAQSSLAGAELVAPIDGVVLFNALGAPASDGSVSKAAPDIGVAPQAPPFTVVQLDSLRFTAEVDEVDVDLVKEGMSATVRLDAFPDRSFETTVAAVTPAATLTLTGGTVFPVHLSLSAADARVLMGMRGDATIEVSRKEAVTRVPVEALFDEGGEEFVYVVRDGRLVRTPVEIGTLTDVSAEIISGVAPGDEVALSSATEFEDNMPVSVK
ncbi:MAG: efflux RND transporter periplasmic adaptor subunit [Coriobacteriia bacterium]|nr:efflux RND transporter periplasmic adaptor subunit [Coriobacteriia bacterium]